MIALSAAASLALIAAATEVIAHGLRGLPSPLPRYPARRVVAFGMAPLPVRA